MKYDYLIVGAGLYGAVYARQKTDAGKKCLVIDRRHHIAGNIYSEKKEGIEVHIYGPHIFHTDKEDVWQYVNRFAKFNHFRYCPVANYKGELYNLPFNMNTFTKIWPDVKTPADAEERIKKQREEAGIKDPQNLEEQAISLVGTDIYEKLIKGYTEKQWGRPCKELPAFIIKRLPVRLTFDNNYFNHPYQGVPVEGYTKMVEKILDGIEVRLGTDYLSDRESLRKLADKVVYTGTIDEYFDYCYGELEYRSLRFETELLDMANFQGVAGMNYTDTDHKFTRIIEHKHFLFGAGNPDKTVITKEYPIDWNRGDEPYYPVNNERNADIYEKYRKLAESEKGLIFGGRLGKYRYMDMDKVIKEALEDSAR
ncbi:UDP-galactopyranose mutase [Lachnospiraceae bacterium C1.1]|nr:UDP-galactopyranose mutase [Lachnospiraceae bacterium C1.1]